MKLKTLIMFFLLATTLVATPVFSASQTYNVEINEAYVFRNILTDESISNNNEGDLFILVRYNLPASSTDLASVDEWCAEIRDNTGCTSTGSIYVDPIFPNTINEGVAFATVYKDGIATSITQQEPLKRIGHGLSGIYVDAGHNITFGNASTEVCIESSTTRPDGTTLVTPKTQDCLYPTWVGGVGSQSDQRNRLANLLSGLGSPIKNLESALYMPQFALLSPLGKITPLGSAYSSEALSFMSSIIPSAFQIGAEAVLNSSIVTPTNPDSAFQQELDTASLDLRNNLDKVGGAYFGMSGGAFATIFMAIIGMFLAGALYSATNNGYMSLVGFTLPMTIGLYFRAPTISAMFGLIVIMGAFAIWYMIRKVPQ